MPGFNAISSRGALVWAAVAADLDGALEVDFHGVRELEGLEVGIGQDRSRSTKVLDLGEPGHELGPGDASSLVNQLNGGTFAVMGHAVANEHVELVVVVLDGQDHGHSLADLDQARDFGSPGSLANLDLHPAADVVTGEVSTDDVEHVDGEGTESDGLLVLIVPGAAQFAGDVPNFLDLVVVLDNDGVLKEGAESTWVGAIAAIGGVTDGATGATADVEVG